MSDPVKAAVQKPERRVTVSLRIPRTIQRELARIGKARYQTMSTTGANLLIEAVRLVKEGRLLGREGRE